jgi:hypothetical protein
MHTWDETQLLIVLRIVIAGHKPETGLYRGGL